MKSDCYSLNKGYFANVEDNDADKKALDQIEKTTESGATKGDEFLESPDLKRQTREAKRIPIQPRRKPRRNG